FRDYVSQSLGPAKQKIPEIVSESGFVFANSFPAKMSRRYTVADARGIHARWVRLAGSVSVNIFRQAANPQYRSIKSVRFCTSIDHTSSRPFRSGGNLLQIRPDLRIPLGVSPKRIRFPITAPLLSMPGHPSSMRTRRRPISILPKSSPVNLADRSPRVDR